MEKEDVSMIKAVIFDLDNTLYNYDIPNQYAEKCVARWLKLHKDMEQTKFRELYCKSKLYVKEYNEGQGASHNRMLYFQRLCELAGWNPLDCALELYNEYWGAFLYKMKINQGVPACLSFLHSNGVKVGICTDLTAYIQHKKIRRLGLCSYIDCLVTSEEAGAEKNEPKIFQLMLDKLACSCNEVVMIGDDFVKDYLGARNVGIKSYWYCTNACEPNWKEWTKNSQFSNLEIERDLRTHKVKSMEMFQQKVGDILF